MDNSDSIDQYTTPTSVLIEVRDSGGNLLPEGGWRPALVVRQDRHCMWTSSLVYHLKDALKLKAIWDRVYGKCHSGCTHEAEIMTALDYMKMFYERNGNTVTIADRKDEPKITSVVEDSKPEYDEAPDISELLGESTLKKLG